MKTFVEKIIDSMVDENSHCDTVKQHSIYNGIKQTVLNRCTVKF